MTQKPTATGTTDSAEAVGIGGSNGPSGAVSAGSLDEVLVEVRSRTPDRFSQVHVICGPAARDDVVIALAQEKGCLGVSVQTLSMFLDSIARSLAPREKLPRFVIRRYIAEILSEEDTEFSRAGLAEEPATLRSLTSIVAKLLDIPTEQMVQHGGARLPEACSEIAERVRASTANEYFTGADVLKAARKFVEENEVITVGVLDQRPFVSAIFEGAPVATIAPGWGGQVVDTKSAETGSVPKQPNGTIVADSFPDEGAEAVAVAREIRRLVAQDPSQSAKLHKIAVACADSAGVDRLVRVLEDASIPVSAMASTQITDLPLVRAFLELLRLDPHEFPRRGVAALLATGKTKGLPGLWDFDRLTRKDFVINAGEDWSYAKDEAENAISAGSAASVSTADSGMERYAQAKENLEKLLHLRETLRQLWNAKSWAEFAGDLSKVVQEYLMTDEHAPLVYGVISELGSLGSVGTRDKGLAGAIDQCTVCEIATEALAGTYGEPHEGKVVVGDLESLVGRDLNHAFVTGLTDVALPGTFVPDAAITSRQSGLTAENYTAYREALWIEVLQCARTLHCSYPRTSIAGEPKANASQWLVRELGGEGDVRKRADLLQELLDSRLPINAEDERVLRGLLQDFPDKLFTLAMDQRAKGEPGIYNGFVGIPEMKQAATELFAKTSSATAIEQFVTTPLEFFIERILGGWVLEDRDIANTIDARERGNIYHHIFEEWTNRVWLKADPRPTSADDIDWDAASNVLDQVVEQELATQQSGRYTGFTISSQEAQVRKTCKLWFEQQRIDAQDGWIPLGAELRFGASGEVPLEIALLDAGVGGIPSASSASNKPRNKPRTLKFSGSIDRVDYRRLTDAGSECLEIRVTDYKTGKQDSFKNITTTAPLGLTAEKQENRDTRLDEKLRLQLALYGAAIDAKLSGRQSELFGDNPGAKVLAQIGATAGAKAPVITARYTFPLEAKANDKVGGTLVEAACEIEYGSTAQKELQAVLTRIVDLVESGNFPINPRKSRFLSEKAVRLGAKNYDWVASRLYVSGVVPPDVYSAAMALSEANFGDGHGSADTSIVDAVASKA